MNTPTAFKTIFGAKGNVKKTDSYYRYSTAKCTPTRKNVLT